MSDLPVMATAPSAGSPPPTAVHEDVSTPAAEPALEARGLRLAFGKQVALGGVELAVSPGEVFCLLGEADSGKSTVLRALAGLTRIDAGSILIDGQEVTAWPARRRPIHTVFSDYALFPHASVLANICFGLTCEGLAKAAIAERVAPILALLELDGLTKHLPARLSVAERLRVALARSLVKGPRVLLLDEPLAALDPPAREHALFALRHLQEQVNVAMVLVTRDPVQAMAMADRMGVLRAGQIAQLGPPQVLYDTPDDRFVAKALGPVNLLEGVATGQSERGFLTVKVPGIDDDLQVSSADALAPDTHLTVAVRPERLRFLTAQDRVDEAFVSNAFETLVRQRLYCGEGYVYRLGFDQHTLQVNLPHGAAPQGGALPEVGERVRVAFAPEGAWVLTE